MLGETLRVEDSIVEVVRVRRGSFFRLRLASLREEEERGKESEADVSSAESVRSPTSFSAWSNSFMVARR